MEKEELEKILNMWKEKDIIIKQEGFIESNFRINKMDYKIEYEILNLLSKEEECYIKINLNQAYKIENEKELKIKIDNDTIIKIMKI